MCVNCGYVSETAGYPATTTKQCNACGTLQEQTITNRVEFGMDVARRAGTTARLEGIIDQMERWEEYKGVQEVEFGEIRVNVSSGFCSGLCAYYIQVNRNRTNDSYFCLLARQNYKKAISLYRNLKFAWREVSHISSKAKQELKEYRTQAENKVNGTLSAPNNKYPWGTWLYSLAHPIAEHTLIMMRDNIRDRSQRNLRDKSLMALTIQGGGLRPVVTGTEYSKNFNQPEHFFNFIRNININGFYVIEFEEPIAGGKKHTTVLQKTDPKVWYMDPNLCEWSCDNSGQAAKLLSYHWDEIYKGEGMNKFTVFQYR